MLGDLSAQIVCFGLLYNSYYYFDETGVFGGMFYKFLIMASLSVSEDRTVYTSTTEMNNEMGKQN